MDAANTAVLMSAEMTAQDGRRMIGMLELADQT
jgi:hypothetical protein